MAPRKLLPENMLVKKNGEEIPSPIPFSSHMFMRSERIDWWSRRVLEFLQMKADSFYEKGTWFDIPDDLSIVAALHRDGTTSRPVLSIVTMPSIGRVIRIHHRMPYLAKRWWAASCAM